MIKEAYVSFEVAKLLKEKGFNCPCRVVYSPKGIVKHYLKEEVYAHNLKGHKKLCPTHQMVTKWLREKYNIYICVQPDFPSDKDYKMCWCWSASILYDNCISIKEYQCYIETYEEATESALKYCLENLIFK